MDSFTVTAIDGKPAISIVVGSTIDINDMPCIRDYVTFADNAIDQFDDLYDFYSANCVKLSRQDLADMQDVVNFLSRSK